MFQKLSLIELLRGQVDSSWPPSSQNLSLEVEMALTESVCLDDLLWKRYFPVTP